MMKRLREYLNLRALLSFQKNGFYLFFASITLYYFAYKHISAIANFLVYIKLRDIGGVLGLVSIGLNVCASVISVLVFFACLLALGAYRRGLSLLLSSLGLIFYIVLVAYDFKSDEFFNALVFTDLCLINSNTQREAHREDLQTLPRQGVMSKALKSSMKPALSCCVRTNTSVMCPSTTLSLGGKGLI